MKCVYLFIIFTFFYLHSLKLRYIIFFVYWWDGNWWMFRWKRGKSFVYLYVLWLRKRWQMINKRWRVVIKKIYICAKSRLTEAIVVLHYNRSIDVSDYKAFLSMCKYYRNKMGTESSGREYETVTIWIPLYSALLSNHSFTKEHLNVSVSQELDLIFKILSQKQGIHSPTVCHTMQRSLYSTIFKRNVFKVFSAGLTALRFPFLSRGV